MTSKETIKSIISDAKMEAGTLMLKTYSKNELLAQPVVESHSEVFFRRNIKYSDLTPTDFQVIENIDNAKPYEEDYFNLTKYEAESAQSISRKIIMKLTKEKIIAIASQCMGIMMCFFDIRHSYYCLKSVFDALKDDRSELLKSVRSVEDAYQKTQDDPYDYKAQSDYNSLLNYIPDRIWVE